MVTQNSGLPSDAHLANQAGPVDARGVPVEVRHETSSALREPSSALREPSSALREPSSALREPSSALREPGDARLEQNPADMRPLSSLRRGQTGVVCMKAVGPQDRDMLRAMGLRPNCALRLCRAGEPCIIALLDGEDCSCRIGLAKELADRIFVSVTVGHK